jgi:hypothetical protein
MENKLKYPLGYNYAQNVNTSDMPDNIHYFLVLPINPKLANQPNYQNEKTDVYILTYESDDMTFLDLVQ